MAEPGGLDRNFWPGRVVESASLCNMQVRRGLADLCDLSYSVAVYVNKRILLGSIFWGSISGVALIGTIGQGIRWLINGEVLRGVLAILFVGGFFRHCFRCNDNGRLRSQLVRFCFVLNALQTVGEERQTWT